MRLSKRLFPHFKLCCIQSSDGSVGILYDCGDFAILLFVLLAINVCLMLYPQSLRLSW